TRTSSMDCVFANRLLDILNVKTAGLRGTKDPELLEIAARQGRILISHDLNSMAGYFWKRIAEGKSSPGLLFIPNQWTAIGPAVEWLLLIWSASEPEEWRDRIEYMPTR